MKKLIFFLFVFIFLFDFVYACQYKVNETYYQEEEWFYFDGEYEGVNLKIDELINIENNLLSFVIYNNLTIPVKVQLNYTLRSNFFGTNTPTSVEIDVGSRDSKIYQEERISTGFGNYYWIEKFIPTILSPKITSQFKDVEKEREICKICPNGKQCLDDGAQCNLDIDCGSSICNIAGFCGHNKTEGCSSDYFNCNDKYCLLRGSVDFPNGTEIGCEEACIYGGESGKCFENQILIKEREDKIIKKWISWIIVISLVFLLIFLLIWEYRYNRTIKRLKKDIGILENKIVNSNKKISELESKGENLGKIIIERENLIKNISKKLNKLRDIEKVLINNIKNADKYGKDKAKKEYENWMEKYNVEKEKLLKEFEVQREKYQLLLTEITEEINVLDKKRKILLKNIKKASKSGKKKAQEEYEKFKIENKTKFEELNKQLSDIKDKQSILDNEIKQFKDKRKQRDQEAAMQSENTKKEIEAALDKYGRIYGREKIEYNSQTGYIQFKSNGKDLHRYIYQNKIGLSDNQEVHHIDKDKLNNDIWNLMAIDNFKHFGFNHGKVEFKDWISGIEQLKKQLNYGTKDNPFPEHIQEEINKRSGLNRS